MAVCEACGNDYDKDFEVIAVGERHTFDSLECAIHRMDAWLRAVLSTNGARLFHVPMPR